MPKSTFVDLSPAEHRQILAALRRARYGYLLALHILLLCAAGRPRRWVLAHLDERAPMLIIQEPHAKLFAALVTKVATPDRARCHRKSQPNVGASCWLRRRNHSGAASVGRFAAPLNRTINRIRPSRRR
jgi:hypothetical protein